ncbi:sensor histidine kinase [Caldisalinibacter kiritimatiensis]|uniref:histidine kinase n=1 Tax=Caldisalinibacter kiritimatiensis TaxID=1304284 RepID=R1CH49_9FIRM|nr:ATP-binding protein [Caldisalinibacter kiritimatiensis]EOD01620.1 Two-component sensor kinase SA14-24 [Caldisalinibacter kiritimatiensis]
MEKVKKILILGISVALVSQVYVNLFTNDFRVSLSVIVFSVLLLLYNDFNIINASIATGIIVFLFRSCILYFSTLDIYHALTVNYPVIFFYSVYGICFYYLRLNNEKNMYKLFLGILACDFLSNTMELFLRIEELFTKDVLDMIKVLFIIALGRTSFVILFISIIKYYRLLLIKEEHEARYRKLILLTSSLKSEIYLMKKNIDYIEKVMGNSYKLYEGMVTTDCLKEQKTLALSIAKDVHEVKKDYIRVIRGIEELTENKIEYSDMRLKDIFYILEESTKRYLENKEINIKLNFKISKDFRTKEHYHIISTLRNLINNSIEAIDSKSLDGIIIVSYHSDSDNHVFKVYDNGRGIKKKDLEYIFQPGFSTKYNRETGDINRGFGLTLVKDVVENHFRGKIKVESNYNVGTVFEILLPKNKI